MLLQLVQATVKMIPVTRPLSLVRAVMKVTQDLTVMKVRFTEHILLDKGTNLT